MILSLLYLRMYYFVYGIFYLISLLPFWILYLLSDVLYIVAYYTIGYRREVVFNNLQIAFPEKTASERKKIGKQFYHNLTDSFVESIKLITLSEKGLLKRCSGNMDVIEDLVREGKNIQLHPGHQFNVEFFNLLYSNRLKQLAFVFVYMPITNKIFDKIFYHMRGRFGSVLVAATNFRVEREKFAGRQYSLTLGADQNPSYIQGAFWMNFFGKPAPFLPGPSRSAIKQNSAIVLVNFIKVKRGKYRFENTVLSEEAGKEDAIDLTRRYRSFIETIVRQQPANYLWTHKRWKHEFKEAFSELWVDDASLKHSLLSES